MSIVSQNIKFLRKKSRLTQEQMAQKIGIKRSLLGAYEEGRADPRLNNLLKISEIFSVSVDSMISKDITSMTDDQLEKERAGKGGFKILSITVDNDQEENIELIPQKASAGYLNGYADPEYLQEMPKFKLPLLGESGTFRAFEISGDSMVPMQSGTVIVGKYLDDLESVKDGYTHVLLTATEGIVYKRVFQLAEKERFLLVSDNKHYSSYEVEYKDVLEIWEARAFISQDFPNPDSDVSLEKLKNIVLDLQQEVIKLKK